jgi:hypothetical protein
LGDGPTKRVDDGLYARAFLHDLSKMKLSTDAKAVILGAFIGLVPPFAIGLIWRPSTLGNWVFVLWPGFLFLVVGGFGRIDGGLIFFAISAVINVILYAAFFWYLTRLFVGAVRIFSSSN